MAQPTLFGTETFTTDSAKDMLIACPLPERTETYTPIPHKLIMEQTDSALDSLGFKVKNIRYRSGMEGQLGQAEYHLQYGNDPEMGLMIAWQNSYNKLTSFKYAIGAHVFVCSNGMVAGDLGAYKRKHTGEAESESVYKIKSYLGEAKAIFDQLIKDKEFLKTVNLTTRRMAELMGTMFVEKQIITSTQLNIMKRDFEAPIYDYGVPKNNAWNLYNLATHAFKEDSPRNWLKRHTDLHKFFTSEFNMESPHRYETESVEILIPAGVEKTVEEVRPMIKEDIGTTSVDDILDMF